MNKNKILKSLKNFTIFLSGSTITHYFQKILESSNIKAQETRAQKIENSLEVLAKTTENIQAQNIRIENQTQDMLRIAESSTITLNTQKLTPQQQEDIGSHLDNIIDVKSKIENLTQDQTSNLSLEEKKKALLEHLESLHYETKGIQKIIKDATESNNNFISNFNMDKFYEYLDSLTLLQESAFLHILLFIALLLIVLNILAALFGNEIIKYLNLEKKYPSLTTFLKLRSTFQKYYLTWNIILMCIVCFAGIGINILVYVLNP